MSKNVQHLLKLLFYLPLAKILQNLHNYLDEKATRLPRSTPKNKFFFHIPRFKLTSSVLQKFGALREIWDCAISFANKKGKIYSHYHFRFVGTDLSMPTHGGCIRQIRTENSFVYILGNCCLRLIDDVPEHEGLPLPAHPPIWRQMFCFDISSNLSNEEG